MKAGGWNHVLGMAALGHAIFISLGILIVRNVRELTNTDIASFLDRVWLPAIELWPLWWLMALVVVRPFSYRALRLWISASVLWLIPAIYLVLVAWTFRGGFH